MLEPRNVPTSQQQQEQQLGAGPIIGPTMKITMVLPVLSLTAAIVGGGGHGVVDDGYHERLMPSVVKGSGKTTLSVEPGKVAVYQIDLPPPVSRVAE